MRKTYTRFVWMKNIVPWSCRYPKTDNNNRSKTDLHLRQTETKYQYLQIVCNKIITEHFTTQIQIIFIESACK